MAAAFIARRNPLSEGDSGMLALAIKAGPGFCQPRPASHQSGTSGKGLKMSLFYPILFSLNPLRRGVA